MLKEQFINIYRFRLYVSREFDKIRDSEDRIEREEMMFQIIRDFDEFIKLQEECLSCGKFESGKSFRDLLCSQCREDYGHSLIDEL